MVYCHTYSLSTSKQCFYTNIVFNLIFCPINLLDERILCFISQTLNIIDSKIRHTIHTQHILININQLESAVSSNRLTNFTHRKQITIKHKSSTTQ